MKPLCNTKIVGHHAARACRNCPAGAVAELGVYDGATSLALRQLCRRDPQYALDTFEGMPYDGSATEAAGGFTKGYLTPVDVGASVTALQSAGITVLKGMVEDTLAQLADERFAFVFLDLDLEAPTRFATAFLLPRLLPGARIGYHDYLERPGYCLGGIAKVVNEFFGASERYLEVTRDAHPRDNRFIFFEVRA